MKDIGNYKLLQVRDAVGRLNAAVERLEAAVAAAEPAVADGQAASGLKAELESLSRDHTALKTTAGRVVTRLDAAIARLGVMVGGQD